MKNRTVIVVMRDWCPECLEYKLLLNRLLSRAKLPVEFAEPQDVVDIQEVRAIPTTLFLEDGRVVETMIDSVSDEVFERFFEFSSNENMEG